MGQQVFSLQILVRELERQKQFGKHAVVFANGCFDLLHVGHVAMLEHAKSQGDLLVVAVDHDESVRSLKGKSRPIFPMMCRLKMVASLACVDYVIPFNGGIELTEIVSTIIPRVIVKSDQYRDDQVVCGNIVESNGGRISLAKHIPGVSTSEIVAKIERSFVERLNSHILIEVFGMYLDVWRVVARFVFRVLVRVIRCFSRP